MPDYEESLRDDVRYAIRFANEGVWDAATGINTLTSDFSIDSDADGKVYEHSDGFKEVLDTSLLSLLGDFDENGELTGADYDLLKSATDVGRFDLVADGVIDVADRNYWLEELARTVPGDADLNGEVNFADFLALSNSFGSVGGWSNGNFDGDDTVTFADFLSLSANFGTSRSQFANVPEPNSAAIAGCFAMAVLPLSRRFGVTPVRQ